MQTANKLNDLINSVAQETLLQFADKNLQANELAISLIDFAEPQTMANFRGEEPIFPASIVKLFYLAAVHQWLEDKKLIETDELKRACKDMIVDSSNDATHYVLDILTQTTGGPELPAAEMAEWAYKRNAVNRYFQSLGYKNININQKTWGEGPYGREEIFVGKDRENRNALTTNATARLLAEIACGKCVSKERSQIMLNLLARDFTKPADDPDNQAVGFMGSSLPKDAKLWSKAGWMSRARHDAAYIELAGGICFVLVVFIIDHARDYWILPTVATKVIKALEEHHKTEKQREEVSHK